MKKQFLLPVLSLFSTLLFAQPKVGIGTSNPKYALHVHTPASQFSFLNLTNSTTADANNRGILLGMQDAGSYLWNYENTPLQIATNNVTRVLVAANGNVGIGNTAPAYILDLGNRMRLRGGTANDIFTTPGIWFDDYRTTGSANAERAFFGMRDSIRLGFFGGGVGGAGWGMNFNAKNGNVGIGSTNDFYRLTLSGSDYALGFYNAQNSFFGHISSSSDTSLEIESRYGSSFGNSASKNILLNPPSNNFFFYPGNVGVGVSVPTAKFQVGGNVMIGTGSPATGYQLSVNGKVICTEAKVQLNSAWPDYVFASSYQKPTLYEVEDYINKHKHLPNIPSAAEVEKDGLLLGDMQKRMMEKVEELTLYLIEIKKENDQLKKRVAWIEKRK